MSPAWIRGLYLPISFSPVASNTFDPSLAGEPTTKKPTLLLDGPDANSDKILDLPGKEGCAFSARLSLPKRLEY